MAEDDLEITPAFAEARRRRADLHAALVQVEQAASGPATGREHQWAMDVVKRLAVLRDAIREHIEVTERPEGLYDEIIYKAPRLAGQIERLRAEHPDLHEATSEMIAGLETTGVGDAWPLPQARDDLQRLLGRLVRHRQLGADLVWEAYNLDIGGPE